MPLDPGLNEFFKKLDKEFSPPPHTLQAVEFRSLIERMSAQGRPAYPADIQVTDETFVQNDRQVTIRVYRPHGEPAKNTLIYMHGGGWTVGSVDTHDPICAAIASETPCAVISINYSLAPERPYPHALLDCEATTDWVLKNAIDLNIDPNKIIIGGDSAGANLATALCLKMRDERGYIPFISQLLIYPVVDVNVDRPSYIRNKNAPFLDRPLMIWFIKHYLGDALDAPDMYAMPMLAKSLNGLPSAFISTAEYDPLLDEGAAYADRLRDAGIKCEYREAKGLMHGFMRVRNISKLAEKEFNAVCKYLRNAYS